MGVIYKATNTINNKSYIGQTNNLSRRKKEHLVAARQNKVEDYSIFHKSIRKYGEDSFVWSIVENCSDGEMNNRETYWIKELNTYIPNGYNMTYGGDDADALLKWQQNNPDKMKENALNGLKYAQKYHQENQEKHLQQLAIARKKGIEATKRKVRCIDLNILFDSLADAERWSLSDKNPNGKKASHQHISKVCRGQRNTAGGYCWEYVD